MPPAPLEAYLELALDVARGLGGTRPLLDRISSYRGRAEALLDDPDAGQWMNEGDPPLRRFPFAFYSLLEWNALAYCSGPEDFPENVPSNFLLLTEHHGLRWEPQDFSSRPTREIRFRLSSPSGGQAETLLRTPEGIERCESQEVLWTLVKLVRHSELGVYEIPVVSEQRWFVVTPKSAWARLERRYGPRWKVFASMEHDWGQASPAVPEP